MAGRTLAEVWVAVKPDTSKTGPELDRQLRGVDVEPAGTQVGHRFGSAIATAVKATVAAVGAALVGGGVLAGKFLAGAIQEATDLGETSSKVGVLFGAAAKDIQAFAAQAATSMGQSRQSALDGAATFAIYGKQAGLTGQALVPFSTGLTKLASDMASFSNTSPEEAIQAIGAAMRGESDPIEKYGVLLNETVLKQVALRRGIIKTTTDALTPQQRVLAVQAALFEQLGDKGSKTIGDFARTSDSLANQQRILTAQLANARAEIGEQLLPVATRFVTQLNSKVVPALMALWREHGPQVVAFLTKAGDKFTEFVTSIAEGDLGGKFARFRAEAGPALSDFSSKVGPAAVAVKQDLVPALKELKENSGETLAATLRVTGVVMEFLARHTDTLAKALPYLAAGYALVKVAQLGANIAMAASPAIRIAEVVATRQQTAALHQHTAALVTNRGATIGATAAQVGETAASNVGLLTRIRATAGLVAHAVAMGVVRVATIAWTAVQWALNVALTANPIGIVIVAIAALVAAIIYAYTQSETFRKIVQVVWQSTYFWIKLVVDFVVGTAWPALRNAWNNISALAVSLYNTWRSNLDRVISFIRQLPGMVLSALGNFASLLIGKGEDLVRGLWNGIQGMGGWLRDKLIGWARSAIPGPIAKALGIASPSRLAADMIGRPFGEGIAAGIESTTGRIVGAVASAMPLSGPPPVGARTAPSTLAGSSAGGGWQQLAELLERVVDAVERVAPGVGKEINGAAAGAVQMARAR